MMSGSFSAQKKEPADGIQDRRTIRHASTFDARPVDNEKLKNRRLSQNDSSPSLELPLGLQSDEKGSAKPLPGISDIKSHSAKFQRALQIQDQCEQELKQFFETKKQQELISPPKSDLGSSFRFEQDAVDGRITIGKSAYERLLRKLSPTIKNTATTHDDLLLVLQSCSECSVRANFCATCSEKAIEFFRGFSSTELASLYGQDLPPVDGEALEIFTEFLEYRQAMATQDHE